MAVELPTIYQQFIHVAHYARYRDDLGRRETWEETVDRYIEFFKARTKSRKIPWDELRTAVLNLEIMPSMRSLMTAGPALDKDQVAGYNCSYLPIDNQKAFDEIMYLLSCGCGVGFSVESRYTNKLPEVPDELHETDTTIIFKDSKLGWASGFREFLSLLYSGKIAKWDVSLIRPSGARLKTFGGRASGPEPLVDLLKFSITVFNKARGRKLSPLECHDLVCKVADVIVSGGVRRSALISLTDLNDDKMRLAKSGNWWLDNNQRALANISAVYEAKPDIGTFMAEWLALFNSHSGERGIFSRKASQLIASQYGRRDSEIDYGTNPCVTGDMLVTTKNGLQRVDSLIDKEFYVVRDGEYYHSNGFWKTGEKQTYNVKTSHGYEFRVTNNHKILTPNGYFELGQLNVGDSVVINNTRTNIDIKENVFDLGWIIGEVVGDGCYNPSKYKGLVRFWGETAKVMSEEAYSIIDAIPFEYNQPVKPLQPTYNEYNRTYQVQSKKIDILCANLIDENKNILPALETSEPSLVAGFLQGVYDADGTVVGHPQKHGICVQISQIKRNNLLSIQRMLHQFGIVSHIRTMSGTGGYKFLPDTNRKDALYLTQILYRLDISRDSIDQFSKYVGFRDPRKKAKLDNLLSLRKRPAYKTNLESKIVAIENGSVESVYDCTVSNIDSFDINGIVVHNCSEIILRPYQFCNLTEVVVRATDHSEDLRRKVRLATILGTLQSTVSDFRYINKKWKKNTEEERLLGVSMTGIMDNSLLNDKPVVELLINMRLLAVETNKEFAKILGIEESAAITCVKPSGSVSQLVDSASGIHPRYSPYYIRRVRLAKTDPLGQFMMTNGYKAEEDFYNKSNWVFSFPMKAPNGSRLVKDITAIQQLEHWLVFQDNWCEHKPSITVYVGDDEWLEVGTWVYKHIDRLSGVSFLPRDTGSYRQAPYEEITEEKYNELLATQNIHFDWLQFKEEQDNTENSKTLACSGNVCEL